MRSVLISGTSTGIGLAAAELLAARGWLVFAGMRDPAKSGRLDAALAKAGAGSSDRVEFVQLDLTDAASIEAASASVLAAGKLDAVVHNAGVSAAGALDDVPREELRRVMEVNFFGVIALTKRLLPALRAGPNGRIVLVSLLLLGGAFGLFVHALDHGHSLAEARTIAINVFVLVEAFYLFNCRSLSRSFWSMGLFSNPWIWGGVGAMAVLQGLLTYWPPLNAIFKTAPIGWSSWGLIIAVAWASSLIIALEKRLGRGRST